MNEQQNELLGFALSAKEISALERIVEYLFDDEYCHFLGCDNEAEARNHIFRSLCVLREALYGIN